MVFIHYGDACLFHGMLQNCFYIERKKRGKYNLCVDYYHYTHFKEIMKEKHFKAKIIFMLQYCLTESFVRNYIWTAQKVR